MGLPVRVAVGSPGSLDSERQKATVHSPHTGGYKNRLMTEMRPGPTSPVGRATNRTSSSHGRLPAAAHKTKAHGSLLHAFGDQFPGSRHVSLRFGALIRTQPGM
jgi:hypothetical protein